MTNIKLLPGITPFGIFFIFACTYICVLGSPDKLKFFQEYVHITQDEDCSALEHQEASKMISCVNFENFVEINGTARVWIPRTPLLMYFDLVGSESLFTILKMKTLPYLTTRLHKWIVMLKLLSDPAEFLREFHTKIKESNFFQENPIFIGIPAEHSDLRIPFYVGYRIDSVASPAVLKEVISESSVSTDLSTQLEEIFKASCQNDLDGTELIVLGVNDSYFDFDTKFGPNSETPTLEDCFVRDVVEGLEITLNFRAKMQIATDWGWLDNKTNTWIGAVGSLLNNTADISISSTAGTLDRLAAADFNFPTQSVAICAVFKRISSYSSSTNYPLLAPFTPGLWATILCWCFLNYLLHRGITSLLKQTSVFMENSKCESLNASLPSSFGAICMQGVSQTPSQISLRTVLFFELIVAVVLNAAYGATLVSFISVETNSIKNIADLVSGRYNFQFTMLMHPVTKRFLKSSPDGDIRQLFHLIFPNGEDDLDYVKKGFVYNDEVTTFNKVGAGGLVYVADDLSSFKSISNILNPVDACQIQDVKLDFANPSQGTLVKKNSGIRRVIDASILKMAESGNLVRWTKQHLSFRPKCDEDNYSVSGADISDISYPLQNLGLMAFIAFFLLLLERKHYARFGSKFIF